MSTNHKNGYARVSTDDQNLDLQRDALSKAGCDPIYEERFWKLTRLQTTNTVGEY